MNEIEKDRFIELSLKLIDLITSEPELIMCESLSDDESDEFYELKSKFNENKRKPNN